MSLSTEACTVAIMAAIIHAGNCQAEATLDVGHGGDGDIHVGADDAPCRCEKEALALYDRAVTAFDEYTKGR